MQKKDRALPTPEQEVYGQEMKAKGYAKGYQACLHDARRRKALKERSLFQQFCAYIDFRDDILWGNRRK